MAPSCHTQNLDVNWVNIMGLGMCTMCGGMVDHYNTCHDLFVHINCKDWILDNLGNHVRRTVLESIMAIQILTQEQINKWINS